MSGGVTLSHSGRQHAYRVALALQRAGMLEGFYTSSYYMPDRIPDRWARHFPRVEAKLRKRWLDGLDASLVHRDSARELPELVARALRLPAEKRLIERRDMSFDGAMARRIPKLDSRAFWGFQGSCFKSLESARAASKTAVVEMASIPGQVIRRLLEREPPTSAGYGVGSGAEYIARTDAEPLRADWCVAASTFCADALHSIGVDRNRIRIIPLGVDVRKFAFARRDTGGPLRVLFVGKMGVHKGLGYLLSAMKRLDTRSVQLTLVGPSVGDAVALPLGRDDVRVLGSVDDIASVYAQHDVLVLPSLYEGFGLVIPEAMGSGMPVVATANTCGPDVIRQGEDGFIVPACDDEAIAARLDWLAGHRDAAVEMGRSASQRAQEFSWDVHARRVGEFAVDLASGALPQ